MRPEDRRAHGAQPPHVGTRALVFEVDYTRVAKNPCRAQGRLRAPGREVTYMSFLMKATVDALKPCLSSTPRSTANNIVYKKDINLGIAVALDWGLIVPVIKHAEEKNLLGLSRASRTWPRERGRSSSSRTRCRAAPSPSRTRRLRSAVRHADHQPAAVAILGVGAIEKRVAVLDDDAIGIRTKGYLFDWLRPQAD